MSSNLYEMMKKHRHKEMLEIYKFIDTATLEERALILVEMVTVHGDLYYPGHEEGEKVTKVQISADRSEIQLI